MSDEDSPPATRFPGFATSATGADGIVEALAERRRRIGLSQTVVAARMGTSQSAVARLEAGHSDARLSTLERYAAALDTTVTFGLDDHGEGRR